ncbi:HD domain-containing protein [Streptomyces sp. NPDC055992]|uniref:HD domain-containing protein n=1 Tax=Streptomyces sp. NPDC055992 TaxID=3345673 RepID=UPI0035D5B5A2
MTNTSTVARELGLQSWAAPDQQRGRRATALAIAVYSGHVRDQGTPYITHPVRVVTILRNELGVAGPDVLILGLLHDALEVSPSAQQSIETDLGEGFVNQLRSMTPDHRLERRLKQPHDADAWHAKIQALGPDEFLVRLADRIDNLRDLRNSPDSGRRARFLTTLVGAYLPLAEDRQGESVPLRAAYKLLTREHHAQAGAAT